MHRFAFTLIELIFVIVVMGILAKFGVEFLAQAYNSFIFSSVNNALQSKSEMAAEAIASRLQYRIKDSVIAKQTDGSYQALASNTDLTAPILEWIGTDIDGFRGASNTQPLWSGIIDLDASTAPSILLSPGTNTTALSGIINSLSSNGTTINDIVLYFTGSDSDIQTGYGWGGAITTQNVALHPVKPVVGQVNQFESSLALVDFSNVDVYEYYQLSWTAYAVGIDDYDAASKTGTLKLWYDYQPWKGETYANGTSIKIMDNVSTFRFKAAGSIIKIEVCVNSDLVEDYSLCKEKTVF
ncbi:MAG: hypothetical protein QG559_1604 [Campylobacterota bacterium]|nr:hypothetical protein [Campylobacterota bacterium]